MSVIETQEDLEEETRLRAYYLSEENHSYDDLCWKLAEKFIKVQRKGSIDIDDIKKKAEEIYKQQNNYDNLCWIIAELDIIGVVDEMNGLIAQKETKHQEEKLSESKPLEIRVETKSPEVKEVFEEKNKPIEEQPFHLKEQEENLNESKPPEMRMEESLSKERVSCPKCGAVGHLIKSVDDKSRVLSYIGSRPIYRKKNVCRKCGQEF